MIQNNVSFLLVVMDDRHGSNLVVDGQFNVSITDMPKFQRWLQPKGIYPLSMVALFSVVFGPTILIQVPM